MGAAGQKGQYQQQDGNRENITVLVTIGADGSTLPPTIIFKGKAYQAIWKQDNPANASLVIILFNSINLHIFLDRLGYSQKGWIDGEIGMLWIKQFNAQTREKAKGCARVLLVDGHKSHYTLGFLDYARTHNIHILCYPSHATHIYQGLDVVCFSILKRIWTEERD